MKELNALLEGLHDRARHRSPCMDGEWIGPVGPASFRIGRSGPLPAQGALTGTVIEPIVGRPLMVIVRQSLLRYLATRHLYLASGEAKVSLSLPDS